MVEKAEHVPCLTLVQEDNNGVVMGLWCGLRDGSGLLLDCTRKSLNATKAIFGCNRCLGIKFSEQKREKA
jgi:hypothetical protein